MTCVASRARLIVGSKNEFTLAITDEVGRPISLSDYASGKLVFCNCDGVRTEITLAVPGANPDRGEIPVSITSTEAEGMDQKWKNADLELLDGASNLTVIPLNDQFEIIERNCPPVV